MGEPFQVNLVYVSCVRADRVTVALDSLEIIHCESGEFIAPDQALIDRFLFNLKTAAIVCSHRHFSPDLFKLETRCLIVHSDTCWE